LDAKHVVFGMVESGSEVTKKIEAIGSGCGDCSEPVIISDCGVMKPKES